MFALPTGFHFGLAAIMDNEYSVNAFIKCGRNSKYFDRQAASMAAPLLQTCFPHIPQKITRADIRVGNFRAIVTVTSTTSPEEGIVAQLLVHVSREGGYIIRALGVAPAHRRRGLGNLLLRTTMDRVLLPKRKLEIRVDTFDRNAAWLLAWYGRLGFACVTIANSEHCLVYTKANNEDDRAPEEEEEEEK